MVIGSKTYEFKSRRWQNMMRWLIGFLWLKPLED